MKIKYILPVIICLAAISSSCKKVIDLQLSNTDPQLIIEANLTDQTGPQFVYITRSVSVGNTNSFPRVSGAVVKITDNNNGSAATLAESSPGTYTTTFFYGRLKHSYTIRVQLNGKTYTATSVMPEKVLIDSIALSYQTFGKSTTKTVAVYYEDPPVIKNQYRMVLLVNNVQVKNIFVRNDQFGDGRSVQALLYQDDITINAGDRVDVEFQCIDGFIYNYWYTFSQQINGNFNNSATPVNPTSNFDGNVLGYFSAHTVQRKAFIVR